MEMSTRNWLIYHLDPVSNGMLPFAIRNDSNFEYFQKVYLDTFI